jgi:hypothetical protein
MTFLHEQHIGPDRAEKSGSEAFSGLLAGQTGRAQERIRWYK